MTVKRRPKKPWTTRRVLKWTALALVLVIFGGGLLVGCTAAVTAPKVDDLEWNSSTIIYDREGKEVYRFHAGENRTPVRLSEIPEHVVEAFLAIEDPDFYKHHGINFRGLARAVYRSTLYMLHLPGGRLEGGSTITQQLARDGWLTQETSLKRKAQEAWVALQLERKYTKDEILEMYLNQIYFGGGAYGIEAAAHTFFAKDVGDLTLAEAAQLAGMINGPGLFNPYENPEDSLERRNLVLAAMLKEEKIDQEQYEAAKAEEPVLGRMDTGEEQEAGDFMDYVISILQDPAVGARYGVKLSDVDNVAKAGLHVYTTLDRDLQRLAEEAVVQQMNQADRDYGISADGPKPEAALVSLNPKTGEVLALVGGRDRNGMLEFNRATSAYRSPGSAIKPLVAYAPALDAGLSPATILDDAPVMLNQAGTNVWPENFDFKYIGLTSMRYALEHSLNPPAVRALQAAGGPAKGVEYAQKFGIQSIGKGDNHLALALGGLTEGVTPLDMTVGFGTLANMGTRVDPVVITKITDRYGYTLFEARPRKQHVIQSSTAYMMNDILKGVIRQGTAYGFTGGFKGWAAAGKTGTSEDNMDGWFVGYTQDLVTTVWNGYDDPDHKLPYTGAFVPVKIWNQFMTQAVTEPPADWTRPSDVVNVAVCRRTGMLPNELCSKDQVVQELFRRGTEPKSAGDLLVKARVVQVKVPTANNKSTTEWQLWQPGCIKMPVERVFIQRPEPRVLHPTDPFNPRYIPSDASQELPTKVCAKATNWRDLLDDDDDDDDDHKDKKRNSNKGQGSLQFPRLP